jgi:hypothetical protein
MLLWIGLFTYESTIVEFGFMFGYLAIWRWTGHPVSRAYLKTLFLASAPVLLMFAVVRHLVVPQAMPLVPLSIQAHNAAMFAAALLTPIDLVFANAIFHTPLPSEIQLNGKFLIEAGISAIVLAVVALAILRRPGVRARLSGMDWLSMSFLAACIPLSLTPFLAFTPHPSETYLYPGAAFYAIVLSLLLWRLLPGQTAYAAVVAGIALLFAAGVLVKNDRVVSCGAAARTILTQLPTNNWLQGSWHIFLATPPGQEPGPRYGIYGYSGLSSIEVEGVGNRAAEKAVQMASRNDQVIADVVPPAEMAKNCASRGTCFWIFRDGSAHEFIPPAGTPAR